MKDIVRASLSLNLKPKASGLAPAECPVPEPCTQSLEPWHAQFSQPSLPSWTPRFPGPCS